MPGKRSKRGRIQHFYCPYCPLRLWRIGSPKHYLFYNGPSEITQHTQLGRKKAAFLATQGAYIDRSAWLEEFLCSEHGLMWMSVHQDSEGKLTATPATPQEWQRTTGTIDPNIPNSSVSEFTQRMSRGPVIQTGRTDPPT
ncbi:hypothetical protein [Anthocerotibacter panamensis]|uniref:hypothetical protein n=1 Tax=Anthocerotibacter panamensis TaxID=2857077 RepID=UPI001C4069E3|nr:hypothetical protein [Anthocerotibacter panamensis]